MNLMLISFPLTIASSLPAGSQQSWALCSQAGEKHAKHAGSEALGPRLVCASLSAAPVSCYSITQPLRLASEHPALAQLRTLTLIAKVIQNLANRAP